MECQELSVCKKIVPLHHKEFGEVASTANSFFEKATIGSGKFMGKLGETPLMRG